MQWILLETIIEAENNVEQAQTELESLTYLATEEDIRTAQNKLDQALAELETVETIHESLLQKPQRLYKWL